MWQIIKREEKEREGKGGSRIYSAALIFSSAFHSELNMLRCHRAISACCPPRDGGKQRYPHYAGGGTEAQSQAGEMSLYRSCLSRLR